MQVSLCGPRRRPPDLVTVVAVVAVVAVVCAPRGSLRALVYRPAQPGGGSGVGRSLTPRGDGTDARPLPQKLVGSQSVTLNEGEGENTDDPTARHHARGERPLDRGRPRPVSRSASAVAVVCRWSTGRRARR